MTEEHRFAGRVKPAVTASDAYAAVLLCTDLLRNIEAGSLPVQELLDLQTMLLNLHIGIAELHKLIADQTASVSRDVYTALSGQHPGIWPSMSGRERTEIFGAMSSSRPVPSPDSETSGHAITLIVHAPAGTVDLLRLYQALGSIATVSDVNLVRLGPDRVDVSARNSDTLDSIPFQQAFATYFPEGAYVQSLGDSDLDVTLGRS